MALRTDQDPALTQPNDGEELQGQMSFLDHLEELRQRIFRILIAVGITFVGSWFFRHQLFYLVRRPIEAANAELNALTLPEGFNLEIKLAFLAAIFLASPFIMGQVWLFISPGLYRKEKRYALPFIFSSSILFVLGGMFGYFIAFPFAVEFLVNYNKEMGLGLNIGASTYFDLFIAIELALGIVFLIPAVIFVLSRIGLVTGMFLLKNTKYAVLIAFAAAALITPSGDIPNMMVMAVPMIALYLLGVIVAFIFGKRKAKEV